MVGETFAGKYTVIRQLGQGGMGAVYEARHQATGRRVALKVMTSEVKKNPALLTRFERETRAAGALDSQYITQVFDGGVDPESGAPFLVMELLAGADLEQLQRKVGPLPQDVSVRIVAQACMGLAKAHAAGIVHRDIKPANMFLAERDDDVVVKLLDFGIAKVTVGEEDATSLTQTGSLIGSPLYMSPEQAAGEKTIDLRTDVWSVGVVLYQALTGRTPHQDAATVGKLILRICQTPAAPIAQLAPWVSPELAEVVHRAVAIEPSARFQSMDAMIAALRPLAPSGFGIRGGMLVGVTEEERGRRPISVPPGPPAAAQSADVAREQTQFAVPGAIEKLAMAEASRELVRTTSASSTDLPSSITGARPPEKQKSPVPLVAIGALATFGIAGAVYFGFLRSGHPDDRAAAAHDDTVQTAHEAQGASPPSTQVQVTPAASASAAPASAATGTPTGATAPPAVASAAPTMAVSAAVTAPPLIGPLHPAVTAGGPFKPPVKKKPTNDPTNSM